MPRQGLTKQIVVQTAIELIERDGLHKLSMRELAAALHVKAASLYNHIGGMDEIQLAIGYYAISQLKAVQLSAIEGRSGDGAVEALALSYYRFAKQRPELYEVILSLAMIQNDALLNAAGDIVEPIMAALSAYDLREEQKMHLQRVFRSILHGFIAQEKAGCFQHFPVPVSESFQIAIRGFINLLHQLEGDLK